MCWIRDLRRRLLTKTTPIVATVAIAPATTIRASVLVGKDGTTFRAKSAAIVPLESANAVVEDWSGWAIVISPVTCHAEKVQPEFAEAVMSKFSPEFSQLALEGVVPPQPEGLTAITREYWC